MIQLKKRVARLKIQHFLKTNKLVLFFHYSLNKNNTKNKSTCDIKTQLLSLGQGSVFFIKNKIAQTLSKKADLQNTNSFTPEPLCRLPAPSTVLGTSSSFSETGVEARVRKKVFSLHSFQDRGKISLPLKASQGNNPIAATNCSIEKNVSLDFAQLRQQTAFFQGPGALLGIKNVNQLHEILKLYRQRDALFLFGGIYGNQVIDCIQVERLGKLSQVEQALLDLQLVRCTQRPVLQVVFILSAYPFCSVLNRAKRRLVEVFNWRINQLSALRKSKENKA